MESIQSHPDNEMNKVSSHTNPSTMVINGSYYNWLQQYRLQYKASITIQSIFRGFQTRNINLQFNEADMINKEDKIDPKGTTNIGKNFTPSGPSTHKNGEPIDNYSPDINDGEGIKHSAYVIDTKCISDTKTSLNVSTKVPASKVHSLPQLISTSSSPPSNVFSLTQW